MRIWYGEEREGADKSEMTLFVETRILTKKKLEIVKSYIAEKNVKRVYYGAGKKNILLFLCKLSDIMIEGVKNVYECDKLPSVRTQSFFHQIILRQDINISNIWKVVPKLDNGEVVIMPETTTYTILDDVKDGMYQNTDEVLWGN